jgi:hypothetical protein
LQYVSDVRRLRFISQVWSVEDCDAVEFIQLNVFGPDLINDL